MTIRPGIASLLLKFFSIVDTASWRRSSLQLVWFSLAFPLDSFSRTCSNSFSRSMLTTIVAGNRFKISISIGYANQWFKIRNSHPVARLQTFDLRPSICLFKSVLLLFFLRSFLSNLGQKISKSFKVLQSWQIRVCAWSGVISRIKSGHLCKNWGMTLTSLM